MCFDEKQTGARAGIIWDGLGAYGERILGSSSEYVQSNVSKYFSDPQYYFQVNGEYVRNKLKVIHFPFLHRPRSFEPLVHKGTTWMVSAETVTKGSCGVTCTTFSCRLCAYALGVFLVKTMKRILFAEIRSYDSSKQNYALLFMALAQFPFFMWLGILGA
ncbi:hypothetical protein IFM89_022628 [Coptis chinensis]|uniref:Uncharacterized protein n=1 Tax=Coptis chinensis TaxID=261450 RepID=A0A835LSI3_9MAGN|nr:hypothetical protein IFM89_022628 [Coptis chinensis]